jgi:hypothetical protein
LEAQNAEFSMNDIECESAIAAPLDLDRFGTQRSPITPMNNQKIRPKREEAHRSETASNDNSAPQVASGRRLFRKLPWAWLALSGSATLLWLIGIGWVAVKLFQWLAE